MKRSRATGQRYPLRCKRGGAKDTKNGTIRSTKVTLTITEQPYIGLEVKLTCGVELPEFSKDIAC